MEPVRISERLVAAVGLLKNSRDSALSVLERLALEYAAPLHRRRHNGGRLEEARFGIEPHVRPLELDLELPNDR